MSPATAPTSAAPFDFREPPRLADAHRVPLEGLQSRFAGSLRTLLTPRLRQVADARALGVELLQCDRYSAEFGAGGVRYHCPLGHTSDAQTVIQLGADIAAHCVDRLFGGAEDAPGAARPLTGIERAVLAEMIERMLPLLRDASVDMVTIAPSGAQYVALAEAPAIVALGETVMVLRFELHCGPATGPLDIALPLAVFASSSPGAVAHDPAAAGMVESHVRQVHVDVTARLGFRAPAFDIASLRVGQVLSTGHPSHADVDIAANGRRLYTAMLGRHQGHVGARILREARPDTNTSRPTRRTSAP